ncbi:winged helix-turn-helix transcriptional regulator [Actinophytocola oryzae]|uniref:HxlR family transcriptional regulator n=1 Tax=Actinophytocola oryzae TaxID=502181 RepID=A0A4R7W0L2_9PSEU|nr:helix-turn-helix domain-containing protein [Actinophytocola oryzae]TDV56056.1 HxlR family transcriptional regulator [Actinophytocola oryzae]
MTARCISGRHRDHDVYAALCPCRTILDLLANKWSALAIGTLEGGAQRFGALQRNLQGISSKVLTQTLRRLEEHGLVDRTVYPAVPLHVEYSLTRLGVSAAAPLAALRAWAEDNLDAVDEKLSDRAADALPSDDR